MLEKNFSKKFPKIHREAPVLESLFNKYTRLKPISLSKKIIKNLLRIYFLQTTPTKNCCRFNHSNHSFDFQKAIYSHLQSANWNIETIEKRVFLFIFCCAYVLSMFYIVPSMWFKKFEKLRITGSWPYVPIMSSKQSYWYEANINKIMVLIWITCIGHKVPKR